MSTATITNGQVLARHKVATDGIEHLDLEVPILSGPQRQGDVLVVPVAARDNPGEKVPAEGVVVVRGETSGGNAHILHALEGECFWEPAADREGLVQGWVTVPPDGAATLIHEQEHNVIGIGPGTHAFHGQREFANEWRRVSD